MAGMLVSYRNVKASLPQIHVTGDSVRQNRQSAKFEDLSLKNHESYADKWDFDNKACDGSQTGYMGAPDELGNDEYEIIPNFASSMCVYMKI